MSLYNPLRRGRAPMAPFDFALLWVVIGLLSISLVMVYSASIAFADGDRNIGYNYTYYLSRHAIFIAVSVLAGVVAFQLPMRFWQQYAPYFFLFGVGLLALVLVPHVGRKVNGSLRWLGFGLFNIQPSELMKLFATLYAADYTVRKAAYMHSLLKGFVPMFFVMLISGFLLLAEPDFGAFVVITAVAMGVLFLGGMNWRLFVGLMTLLGVGFVLIVVMEPYRLQRVIGFMNPWKDPYGKGYQLSHSLIAIGRGEWFGVGLGGSIEKLFYLPEAHTDFLLAVIGEEFGFIGVAVVLSMLGFVALRAFQIGRQATKLERYYSALVAQAIGLWLGVQSVINIGVNMGVLPTKGLTLPLMSFGGSGMVANVVAIAIVLRVDWENRQMMRGVVR